MHIDAAGRSLPRLGNIWATNKSIFIVHRLLGRFPHRSDRLGGYPARVLPPYVIRSGACQLRVYFPRRRSNKIVRWNGHNFNARKSSPAVPGCFFSTLEAA